MIFVPQFLLAAFDAVWALVAAGTLALGVAIGYGLVRTISGKTVGDAKAQAQELISRAESDARGAAEKVRVEAEKAVLERKEKFDKEASAARDEVREAERRLTKREDLFDRKEEALGLREQSLTKQGESLKARDERVAQTETQTKKILEEQTDRLHRLADMSSAQAKELLLERVEQSARMDVAKVVRKITEEAETEAKEKAREITLMAIQRFASEHTSESTVRTVEIPSDDMKGRIIGREGRNIRAIEKATGVDIIVDDTPGVIVVSCFDKVRQAVAVESLQRLIQDGRMHPSRIEEVVDKVRSEIAEKP